MSTNAKFIVIFRSCHGQFSNSRWLSSEFRRKSNCRRSFETKSQRASNQRIFISSNLQKCRRGPVLAHSNIGSRLVYLLVIVARFLIGGLRHNTVMAGWPQHWKKSSDSSGYKRFLSIVRASAAGHHSLIVPKNVQLFPNKTERIEGEVFFLVSP